MIQAEATYQYLEEENGNGMFFYTGCCGNRMYSVDNDPMKYHGCLCPKCFWHNKLVTLYLRGTPDGIRVFENEHFVKRKEGDEKKMSKLETEIENLRMRAIMSENIGNTSEAKNEWYLYECLSALKNIQDSGDCNVCASKKDCQYIPKPGQMVRYNCPFYKKEGEENGH